MLIMRIVPPVPLLAPILKRSKLRNFVGSKK
jgi:hypothetical protein